MSNNETYVFYHRGHEKVQVLTVSPLGVDFKIMRKDLIIFYFIDSNDDILYL